MRENRFVAIRKITKKNSYGKLHLGVKIVAPLEQVSDCDKALLQIEKKRERAKKFSIYQS